MIKHQFLKWLPIVKHEDHLSRPLSIAPSLALSNTLAHVGPRAPPSLLDYDYQVRNDEGRDYEIMPFPRCAQEGSTIQ